MNTAAKTRSGKIRALTECAVLTALASILSLIELYKMPYGGAVTAASMLPMLIIAYRHGMGYGFGSGLVYAVIQQLLGLSNLSYATTWQAVLAIIFLDYVLAFIVVGLGGIFRRKNASQTGAIIGGALLVCLLRYACHVISGATVWAGISIPTKAALVYSFSYNATYMLPETIVLIAVGAYLSSVLDLGAVIPTRIKRKDVDTVSEILEPLGGLLLVGGIIFDTVKILPRLQNPESGEFDIALLGGIDYTPMITVTAVTFVLAAVCFVVAGVRKNKRT